jgi:hypothetical protein
MAVIPTVKMTHPLRARVAFWVTLSFPNQVTRISMKPKHGPPIAAVSNFVNNNIPLIVFKMP